jgi:protein O-mannosyl-transferase
MKKKKTNKKNKFNFNSKSKFLVFLFFLIMVPAVLYFKEIYFDFSTYDDTTIIKKNFDTISNLNNVPFAFTVDAFFTHQFNIYRPLQIVSFMVDAQISGQRPWAYHLTNLILHILIVIIFFILLTRFNIKQAIAFLLALIYSVHPLLTSAVCWIPARGDLLLALFGLSSFIAFIDYFNYKGTIYLVIHFICFFLSCFAKETALIIPLLLVVYFYLILLSKIKWKRLIPFLIIWFSAILIYLSLRDISISAENASSVSGLSALIKNLPAIPITFGKIFFPFGLTTMPLFNSSSILFGILLLIFIFYVLIKNKIYKNPYIIFGALWFLGFTLPPLYFRLRNAEFSTEYFEHRTMLPLTGIIMMLGIFCSTLLNHWSSMKIAKIFIPLIIFYAILSYVYCNDYSGPITFFSSAIASNSNNAVAFNSRGTEYIYQGEIQKAQADFNKAIEIDPFYSSPYYNKGLISHSTGDYNKAEYLFSEALRYDTLIKGITFLRGTIIFNLSGEKLILKKYDEALSLLRKGVNQFPENGNMHYNLGLAYYYSGKYDSAKFEYDKAIRLEANSFIYYINRGKTEIQLARFVEALIDFNKALELKPDFGDAYFYRGTVFMNLSKFNEAISDFNMTIGYNPLAGEAYYLIGVAYAKNNMMKEARENFKKATSIGYKDVSAKMNK